MDLSLHIILQNAPVGLDYSLQKGSGNNYETVQVQRSGQEDMHFYLTVDVKGERPKNDTPRLRGPFVQGLYPENFIYIDIGTYAGQADAWGGRLKIPLSGITWDAIDKVVIDPKIVLETYIPGTKKDGKPNCATVKPFDGWKISS